jgi:DNA-binding XRE family transcriptional regulator
VAVRKRLTGDHGPSEVRLRESLQKPIERAQRRLGLRLRQLRDERNLTQEQAAELAGLHAKHLSVIENAGVNVTFTSLVALAVAYKVSLSAFFEGSPVVR